MTFLIIKLLTTAAIIAVVSEIAKRTDRLGALIASLPFVIILTMIWMYFEKQSLEKIANLANYSFWFVIPTLPMLLTIPWMLRKGINFWISLGVSVIITFVCFILTAWIAKRFGIQLFP